MAMLTGLFETMSAGAYPLASITRLGEEIDRKGHASIRYLHVGEGKAIRLFKHEWESLLNRPVQLIPAQPGTSIITCDREAVSRTPLIAWALCVGGEVLPVTPYGVTRDHRDGDGPYVEFPNGTIETTGDWADPCWFPNADEMLAHRRRKAPVERPSDPDGEVAR